jgi:DNA-binding transcriptional LysR family regulator
MELRHLRYLVAVAEELHFGRAALRLNISQPPLSQQIRQLEEELGVQLFQRTKRAVRMTEAGRRIVQEAYRVLNQVDNFVRVAAGASAGEVGSLTLASPGGMNEVLVEALSLFGRQYPGVHIELQHMSTGTQIDALRERRLPRRFRQLPVHEPTLVLETVKEEPLWIALPKGHALARRHHVPLAALANERFILFGRRVSPGLHDIITGACRDAGFSINVAHEVDSLVAGLTLVRAGLGVAFCFAGVQKLWPDLEFRSIKDQVPTVEYAVAYSRDEHSPVLELFLRTVRQIARRSGPAKKSSRNVPVPA